MKCESCIFSLAINCKTYFTKKKKNKKTNEIFPQSQKFVIVTLLNRI